MLPWFHRLSLSAIRPTDYPRFSRTVRSCWSASHRISRPGQAFKENIAIAGKIGQLIDEIATASEEQSHGVSQVNTAVAEMDKVTQSAAASAEESAAASEELNAQAEQMKVYVEELQKVVGGSGNDGHGGVSGGHGVGLARIEAGPRKGSGFSEKKAVGRRLAGPGERAKTPRRPEQVIPLIEGEFKDF